MICTWTKCDNEFTPKNKDHLYCSKKCKSRAHNYKCKIREQEKKERLEKEGDLVQNLLLKKWA